MKQKRLFFSLLGISLLGFILRFAGAFNDLWLDEILSLEYARGAGTAGEVLTFIYSDNNHILNTWWLYLLQGCNNVTVLRFFSLVCGCGMLALLMVLKWPRGGAQRFFAAALCSFSYLLILYSSEARGYAPMLFFALCLLLLLPYYESRPRWYIAPALWLCAGLGFLAQFSFVQFYSAFLVWSLWRAFWRKGWHALAEAFVVLHLAPLAFFAVIYFVHIQYMPAGSGDLRPYADTIFNLLSLGLGAPVISALNPQVGALALLLAAAVLLVAGIELVLLWRERSDWWLFYVMGIFLAPLCSILVFEPRVLYERYLLPSQLCVYLLLAGFLARIYQRSIGGRVISVVLLAAFVCSNGRYVGRLIAHGRGQYMEALSFIARESPDSEIQMAGDHDFRNSKVIDYYAPRLEFAKKMSYLRSGQAQQAYSLGQTPLWFVAHSQDPYLVPFDSITPYEGVKYRLEKEYPAAPLSGWRWFVYRSVQP